MVVYKFLDYTIDPYYALEFMENMWATEPVGTLSIILSFTGLMLTLAYKLLDIWWDICKEKSRQGKLKIELYSCMNPAGELGVKAVISNTGKEPVGIREVGHFRGGFFRTEFVPVFPVETPLPMVLNGKEVVEVKIHNHPASLLELIKNFSVKDSLGKTWEAPASEIKRIKHQLKLQQAAQSNEPQKNGTPSIPYQFRTL